MMELNFSTFGKYAVIYPFLMRGFYLLRQAFEPFYMDSVCLLDLVRVSSPEHWKLHPTWSHMMKHHNETCEDRTGIPMSEHFDNIYNAGVGEYKIFWGVFGVIAIVSTLMFLQRLFTGKVRSVIGVFACLVLAFNQGSLFHLLSHYQNDVSHLNGNVMHHSNYSRNGDNAALVNTLPPGLIINFLQNYWTVMFMAFVLFKGYFKRVDMWTYFSLCTPLILAKFVLQMAYIHPYIHTQGKSWYGTFIHPLFTKYIMDEYKGHVLCHHVTGSCLGKSCFESYPQLITIIHV